MKLNLFLALALVLAIACGLLIRIRPSRPNVEFVPEMVRTASYNAYSANPNFPDGKTMREPPPYTIPRGFQSEDYQATEAGAVRAGEELANPYNFEDLAAFARGAFVFQNWCMPCHGATGRGDGQVAMRGFPAPPPLSSEKTLALKDGRMFHILTFGQKNMPSYASQISEDDRWKVILYVRSLQKSAMTAQATPARTSSPDSPTGQERQK